MRIKKIGLGGGCHWCTEAVFQSLAGIIRVEQGWIASTKPNEALSEAIIAHFDDRISLTDLIEIHLLTHSSSNEHSMRKKYRSAIYYFEEGDMGEIKTILFELSATHNREFITKVLSFSEFKPNSETLTNYYAKNKSAPFCETYIHPKLNFLKTNYGTKVRKDF